MYLSGRSKYSKYSTAEPPPNYAGQYAKEQFGADVIEAHDNSMFAPEHKREPPVIREEQKSGLLGGLLGGKSGGLLGNIFGKDKKNGEGILGSLELEDLILIGVMFFLLKDGAEDDILIILAILLFTL